MYFINVCVYIYTYWFLWITYSKIYIYIYIYIYFVPFKFYIQNCDRIYLLKRIDSIIS
ncbi:hypothetical protein ACMBCM_06070 [Spiroplasma sp. K1]